MEEWLELGLEDRLGFGLEAVRLRVGLEATRFGVGFEEEGEERLGVLAEDELRYRL